MEIGTKYLLEIAPVIENIAGVLRSIYDCEVKGNDVTNLNEWSEVGFERVINDTNLKRKIESVFPKIELLKPTPLKIIEILKKDFDTQFTASINKSLLAGEHYEPKTIDVIKDLKRSFKDLELVFDNFREKLEQLGNLNIINSFDRNTPSNYFNYLEYFLRLAITVQANLDFQTDHIHLVASFDEVVRLEYLKSEFVNEEGIHNDFLRSWYFIFLLNVKLAEEEDNLVCDMNKVRTLLNIQHYFESNDKLKGFPIVMLLIDKCKYLLKKIALRLKRDSRKSVIIDDYDPSISTKVSLDKNEIVYFKEFDELTKQHYLIDFQLEPNDKAKEIQTSLNRHGNLIKFSDIHYLVRYYSKNFESEDVLKHIDAVIKYYESNVDEFSHERNKYDYEAYETTHSFIYNHKLKILRLKFEKLCQEGEEISLEKIKTSLKEIEKFLDEIERKIKFENNYFQYHEICKIYNKYILILIDTKADGLDVETIHDIIEKFGEYIINCKSKLQWCKKNNIAPLYLPAEDCIKYISFDNEKNDNKEDDFTVLLDSSYILPIPYHIINEEIELLKDEFGQNRVILLNRLITSDLAKRAVEINAKAESTINSAITNVKVELKEAKDDIKNRISQNVQIVGIFASIITFTLGSLKVIPDFKDYRMIIIFMLGLALSLSFFISLLHSITNHSDWKPDNTQTVITILKMNKARLILNFLPSIVLGIALWFTVKCYDIPIKIDNGTHITNIDSSFHKNISVDINETRSDNKSTINSKSESVDTTKAKRK